MMDIEPLFRYKTPNAVKLSAYGFLPEGEGVSKTIPILRGAFGMKVTVAPDGAVRFKVPELAAGEIGGRKGRSGMAYHFKQEGRNFVLPKSASRAAAEPGADRIIARRASPTPRTPRGEALS